MIRFFVMSLAVVLAGTVARTPSFAASPTPAPIFRSLPPDVQEDIKDIKRQCRRVLGDEDEHAARFSFEDEGLTRLLLSGLQAVMINRLEMCDGMCLRGGNCSNRNSYAVAVYVRSGDDTWTKALSVEAVGNVFLSTDWLRDREFKVAIISILSGIEGCPTHDVQSQNEDGSYVFPAWKQTCDTVVKWDGVKFTYQPL
jgi:hypothetical protein